MVFLSSGTALLATSFSPTLAEPARAAVAAVAGPAQFDGVWTIDASTTSFFCPLKRKQLFALVRDGALQQFTGLPGVRAAGHVDHAGAVTMNVFVLGHVAQIQGRLTGRAGEGAWSSNSSICAQGNWRAWADR